MSTVYYTCGYCGDEIGSAQHITMIGEVAFHPNCAPSVSTQYFTAFAEFLSGLLGGTLPTNNNHGQFWEEATKLIKRRCKVS